MPEMLSRDQVAPHLYTAIQCVTHKTRLSGQRAPSMPITNAFTFRDNFSTFL
jgi:hypothetical protein